MRAADALKADGKLAEAVDGYGRVLKEFPLAEAAPRAAFRPTYASGPRRV